MTCTLPSRTIRGMTYNKGVLTVQLPRYDRSYECDQTTAYQLAYSKEPMKFYNENIKNKLRVIDSARTESIQ